MSDENNTSKISDERDSVGSSVLAAHPSEKREKGAPESRREPVSLFAVVLCATALVAGGSYLGATNGGINYSEYQVPGYEPNEPMNDAPKVKVDPNDPKVWRKAGKGVYSTTCNGCHQANGLGLPGAYPPLAKSDWVTNGSERFSQIILKGLQGPIEVNGQAFNAIMPPHGDQLNDKQIAQVMSYVRYEFGNGIEERITKEMVEEARKRHGGFAGSYTADQLAPAGADLPGVEPPAEGGAAEAAPVETPVS